MDVLIDLDAAPPPVTTGRRRIRLPRWSYRVLILVALALALVLPSSAAPGPAPLTELFTLAMPGNAAYVLRGQVLYAGGDTALVAEHGKDSLLVFGTVSRDQLERLAASLTTATIPG